jgi:hypothetical protein
MPILVTLDWHGFASLYCRYLSYLIDQCAAFDSGDRDGGAVRQSLAALSRQSA